MRRSLALIVQVILMVVDMWSKKASKKSKSKAAEKMQTTALNEVGQNRVLMSDGNWVIFDL